MDYETSLLPNVFPLANVGLIGQMMGVLILTEVIRSVTVRLS